MIDPDGAAHENGEAREPDEAPAPVRRAPQGEVADRQRDRRIMGPALPMAHVARMQPANILRAAPPGETLSQDVRTPKGPLVDACHRSFPGMQGSTAFGIRRVSSRERGGQ